MRALTTAVAFVLILVAAGASAQSPDEIEKAFVAADADHDGKLSPIEFKALPEAIRSMAVDVNGDGYLTLMEMRPWLVSVKEPAPDYRIFFIDQDRNRDGKLDAQEFAGLPKATREAARDADGDGFYTMGELRPESTCGPKCSVRSADPIDIGYDPTDDAFHGALAPTAFDSSPVRRLVAKGLVVARVYVDWTGLKSSRGYLIEVSGRRTGPAEIRIYEPRWKSAPAMTFQGAPQAWEGLQAKLTRMQVEIGQEFERRLDNPDARRILNGETAMVCDDAAIRPGISVWTPTHQIRYPGNESCILDPQELVADAIMRFVIQQMTGCEDQALRPDGQSFPLAIIIDGCKRLSGDVRSARQVLDTLEARAKDSDELEKHLAPQVGLSVNGRTEVVPGSEILRALKVLEPERDLAGDPPKRFEAGEGFLLQSYRGMSPTSVETRGDYKFYHFSRSGYDSRYWNAPMRLIWAKGPAGWSITAITVTAPKRELEPSGQTKYADRERRMIEAE